MLEGTERKMIDIMDLYTIITKYIQAFNPKRFKARYDADMSDKREIFLYLCNFLKKLSY